MFCPYHFCARIDSGILEVEILNYLMGEIMTSLYLKESCWFFTCTVVLQTIFLSLCIETFLFLINFFCLVYKGYFIMFRAFFYGFFCLDSIVPNSHNYFWYMIIHFPRFFDWTRMLIFLLQFNIRHLHYLNLCWYDTYCAQHHFKQG